MFGEEKIVIEPQAALTDEKVKIRLEGFQPHSHIRLEAEMTDDLHTVWESRAVFTATETGTVDLTSQMPDSGSYDEADAMGLFWSMAPQNTKDLRLFSRKKYSFFIKNELTVPSIITFKAFVKNQEVASSFLERLYMTPGVTIHDIREDGVVGKYFLPAGEGYRSALLLIGGLDGTQLESEAALLASHGMAVLTVKYFGKEKELPHYVGNVPIEYFKKCIDWLIKKTGVSKVGLLGRSKGAEVSLLVASHFPDEVGIVIANIPSSIVLFGIKSINSLPFPPAWTYQGKSLPYLQMKLKWSDWLKVKVKLSTGQKFSFADYYRKAISDDRQSFKQSVIHVENIRCPIFIISATDDAIWPSSFYCDQIVERLKKFNFKYAYEHLDCKQAGHYICNANWPAGLTDYWKVYGYKLEGIAGGNPRHNAHAARDFWKQALKFIDQHFKN